MLWRSGIIFLISLNSVIWGQNSTAINLATQGRNVDFSNFTFTRPIATGSALPATCQVGQLFLNTAAATGANLYSCLSQNTWTVLGGYTLPPAGASTLGGVSIPTTSGLTLGGNGVLSVNFGTASGTVAAGNDPRIVNALQPTSSIPAANITGLAHSATVDTTNASNITSGLLSSTLLPSSVVLNSQVNTYVNKASPATPGPGNSSCWTDATNKNWECKNDSGTIFNSILASSGGTNQFATGISAAGIISYAQPSFNNLSGTIASSQLGGTVSGDLSGSLPNPTVAGVNGTSIPRNSSSDQTVVTTGAATGAWTSFPNCTDSGGQHLNYNTTTHLFSCGSTSSGSGGGGIGGSGSANALPLFTGSTTLGSSSLSQNSSTGAITSSKDFLCNSQRPCVDLVALGANSTGGNVAGSCGTGIYGQTLNTTDCAMIAAHKYFNGLNGGTIVGCGTFFVTQPWQITNPGLKITSNCGVSGWAEQNPLQEGGFVIESSVNATIPAQTAGPTVSTSTSGGSLPGNTTYYIATTIVNGFGATTPSPVVSVTTGSGNSNSITISNSQYQPGATAYNIYVSTASDGTGCSGPTYTACYQQPAGNFQNNGPLTGPPFLLGGEKPVLQSFSTPSGEAAPTSNTATHGLLLMQAGNSTTTINAGPTIENITFYDSSGSHNTLAGGLALVFTNRAQVLHCQFDRFEANGSPMGGEALYEQGGIGLYLLNPSEQNTGNYNDVKDIETYANRLGMLNEVSDTTVYGGNFSIYSGDVGLDYPGGNIRIYGPHINMDTGALAGFVLRGNSIGAHYGAIVSAKEEGLYEASGPAIQLRYMRAVILDLQCNGPNTNPAEACVTIDSNSSGNVLRIAAVAGQLPFSDGTTAYNDPTGQNIVQVAGNTPGIYFGKSAHLFQVTANGDLAGRRSCSSGTYSYTYNNAFSSTPSVVVSDETTAGGARVSSSSATGFTVSCSGSTDTFDYHVIGNPN